MTQNPLEQFEALAKVDPAQAARVLQQISGKVWVPHGGGQQEVLSSQARFRILRAGRRWGKTELAAHEVIMAALSKPNQMVWWVANSDKNVRRGYRKVLSQLPRNLLATNPPSDKSNDRILEFKNGSTIEFYTGGSPDSLAGEGVNFVVVDEAALIPENVWFQLIRPTLSDTGGRALIISTPRGRNWFWRLWQRGQAAGSGYESFHYVSDSNPTIAPGELDEARETLPDIIFRQEYLAEFVENAASMFSLMPTEKAPMPVVDGLSEAYGWIVMGIDLAKKEDFTVIRASRQSDRMPVLHDRINSTSWPVQEDLIIEHVRDLESRPEVEGVSVVIDSTGIGDVVYDHLDEKGLDVIPVNFGSGVQKERMVRLLASDVEHGRAHIYAPQVPEFEAYEYEITPNGRYKFEAVTGHDDEVSATLLENWGHVHEGPPDVKFAELERDLHDEAEKVDTGLPDRSGDASIRPDPVADIMRNPAAWASYRA